MKKASKLKYTFIYICQETPGKISRILKEMFAYKRCVRKNKKKAKEETKCVSLYILLGL